MKDIDELVFNPDVKYAKDHEWVSVNSPYRLGISDFAQDQLGDLTYVELPEVGETFALGDEFGSLESIKSVSSLFLPVSGRVTAVNEALCSDPGLVNRDPYGEGWIAELELADAGELANLMDADTYRKHIFENA